MKSIKGFTLIELIVVIVIIGILVLLATPKFLNYIKMAKLTQIKHDTKVLENVILAHMIKFNGELPSWAKTPLDDGELEDYLIDGKVYTSKGKVLEDGTIEDNMRSMKNVVYAEKLEEKNLDIEDDFYIVSTEAKKEQIRSRLKGTFIVNKEGKGVYVDEDILDEDEVIRVGGRTRNSVASYDQKHQMLLPPKKHLTKLIIKHEHTKLLHAGPQAVLTSLRNKF